MIVHAREYEKNNEFRRNYAKTKKRTRISSKSVRESCMIEYKDIEKIVYLIPERNFYDGVIDSKIAREYQAYIEFQSQKYNQTKRKCDWDELKRLNTEYETYLANEVDVKRKLLWFGLLRRSKEEMEEECLKLIERFHLERWV